MIDRDNKYIIDWNHVYIRSDGSRGKIRGEIYRFPTDILCANCWPNPKHGCCACQDTKRVAIPITEMTNGYKD
jgi:hypothetical protein